MTASNPDNKPVVAPAPADSATIPAEVIAPKDGADNLDSLKIAEEVIVEPKDGEEVPPKEDADAQKLEEEAAKLDIDYKSYASKIETGDFNEEDKQALIAKGVPEEVLTNIMDNAKAKAEVIMTDMFSVVGGKDKYVEMAQLAAKTLPKERLEAYNAVLGTRNIVAIKGAIKALDTDLKASLGSEGKPLPSLLPTKPSSSVDANGFTSRAEVTAAMKDPRYFGGKDPVTGKKIKSDAEYVKSVKDRLRNTQSV